MCIRDRPDAAEGAFTDCDFIHVHVDSSQDDGLCSAIFDEAYVGRQAVPSFLFFKECLELRKWRYRGAEVKEVVRRLKRIVAGDRIEEGPEAEEEETE